MRDIRERLAALLWHDRPEDDEYYEWARRLIERGVTMREDADSYEWMPRSWCTSCGKEDRITLCRECRQAIDDSTAHPAVREFVEGLTDEQMRSVVWTCVEGMDYKGFRKRLLELATQGGDANNASTRLTVQGDGPERGHSGKPTGPDVAYGGAERSEDRLRKTQPAGETPADTKLAGLTPDAPTATSAVTEAMVEAALEAYWNRHRKDVLRTEFNPKMRWCMRQALEAARAARPAPEPTDAADALEALQEEVERLHACAGLDQDHAKLAAENATLRRQLAEARRLLVRWNRHMRWRTDGGAEPREATTPLVEQTAAFLAQQEGEEKP